MIEVFGIDPRVRNRGPIPAPEPLPHVSRKALRRVRDRVAIPTTCHLCGETVKLVNNAAVYGKSHGRWPFVYLCQGCRATVGVHPHTDLPLGTLADEFTRFARREAKAAFQRSGLSYDQLAERMGIEPKHCHFGMFTEAQCAQIKELLA